MTTLLEKLKPIEPSPTGRYVVVGQRKVDGEWEAAHPGHTTLEDAQRVVRALHPIRLRIWSHEQLSRYEDEQALEAQEANE